MLKPHQNIIVYMEGHLQSDYGKMGHGVLRYSKNPILGVIDSKQQGQDLSTILGHATEIPILQSLEQGRALGGEVLILGIAPSGGKIPSSWHEVIQQALALGYSIVNGLHDLLLPTYASNLQPKQWIWDVRVPPQIPAIASGKAKNLSNKRVLFVGTDMASGKMTAALEIYSEMRAQELSVSFVATGQIGITLTGAGIPLDAYKVDHACGAVEEAVLEQQQSDWILIEGQGSLLHPGSTATLPLMRGSCPTHLILCVPAHHTHLRNLAAFPVPPLPEVIQLNETVARAAGNFPNAKVVGIALNTSQLTEEKARQKIIEIANETGLPTTDPVRFEVSPLIEALGV